MVRVSKVDWTTTFDFVVKPRTLKQMNQIEGEDEGSTAGGAPYAAPLEPRELASEKRPLALRRKHTHQAMEGCVIKSRGGWRERS